MREIGISFHGFDLQFPNDFTRILLTEMISFASYWWRTISQSFQFSQLFLYHNPNILSINLILRLYHFLN